MIGGGFGIAAWEHLLPECRAHLPPRHARAGARPPRRPRRARHRRGLIGAAFVGFEALDSGAPERSEASRGRASSRRGLRGAASGAPFMMPLAVCATPIGNLEDVTLRVLAELAAADVVLCEDTRHTRGLLDRHGIEARLLSYHEHNEAKRTAELVPRLEAGERIALVSDAGLPGISDPGGRLVRAALDAGVPVTVLPGPSAVETALVASGLVGERYQFLGFLPRGRAAARGALGGAARVAVAGGRVRVAAAASGDAALARRGRAGRGRSRCAAS